MQEKFMFELTPQQQISRMLTGTWVAQALYVAAKLGLADLVSKGPQTADELAATTRTNPRALYRLLRALASLGAFAEDDRRRFAMTPLAECLRSDVPGSQWAMAILFGEVFHRPWGELLSSVQTGRAAFEAVYGLPHFEFLNRDPELSRLFDETMVGIHGGETDAILSAYPLSDVGVLADLGGGNGSVLNAALRKYPHLHGLLFDLPGVAERARAGLRGAGLAERCRVVGGDFFESVPAGADAYLLRHIVHDWDDDQATQILRNIHRAAGERGKLLVVESVIPPGNGPSFGKLLDLAMLALPGGQERTEEEYRALYEAAGFRLTRVVPTGAEVSVIEGEKV
jgi:hypothetical protein